METNAVIPDGAVSRVCRDGEMSVTIVAAVAAAKGVDSVDLDPLYHAVDPDIVDMAGRSVGALPTELEIRFVWEGCQIAVHGDGEVVVVPTDKVSERPADPLAVDG